MIGESAAQPPADAYEWLSQVDHVGAVLGRHAEERAEATALRWGEISLTYKELEERTRELAHGFAEGGVARGDRVGVMLPNSVEHVLAWLALGRAGAVYVGLNTGYRGASLAHLLRTSGTTTLLVAPEFAQDVEEVRGDLPGLETVLTSLDELPAGRGAGKALAAIRPGEPWMFIFTSGTTGLPKVVEFSQRYAMNMALDVLENARLESVDVTYTCFPLYHAEAPLCNVLPALLAGGTAAVGVKFSASGFWDEVRAVGATFFTHLGGIITMLDKQPPRPDDADNPVTRSFGFPTPQNWRDIQERFGLTLVEWGGSSEGGIYTMESLDDGHRDGCSGRPTRHYDVRVLGDDDRELGPGEVGEIVSRPLRPFGMMTGYAGDPDATARAFRNLWYRSGDLGAFTGDGLLQYAGRTKDAIRRRGVFISSIEVEQTLEAHPAVLECAAIGVPSELGEEDLKVVVTLRPGAEAEVRELVDFAGSRLPRTMIPRYVEFADELPKTTTGKIRKEPLRESWRTPATYDCEREAFLVVGGA